MDLGKGKDAGKFVPVQIASVSDEWWDMPAMFGKPRTPHVKTSSGGESYVLSGTFSVDHYYAIVVDIMAVSGVNICGTHPVSGELCCASSEVWKFGEFEVDALFITF